MRLIAPACWRIAKRRKSPRDLSNFDPRKWTAMASNLDTLVTVFGGSGFLGRSVVRALAKRDYRIRVAVRRPELAGHLQPLGKVGQIHAVQANLRYPASVEAAMRGFPRRHQSGRHPGRGRRPDFRRGAGRGRGRDRQGGRRRRRADGACLRHRRRREFAVGVTAAPRPRAKRRCWRRCRRRPSCGRRWCSAPRTSSPTVSPALATDIAAAAADRRRRDQAAAGLCRRRRDRGRRCRRRQDQSRAPPTNSAARKC